jgi:nucleotide-binding universal stress UspA family protein
MYDAILVPTDGSETAERALDTAANLARTHDSALHVVSVVDLAAHPDASMADTGPAYEALEEAGQRSLDRAVDRMEEAGVGTVEASLLSGEPASSIVASADERDVDLVVMGTHGRSGIGRLLLGSVTERVLRETTVPVLVVDARDD